MSRIVGWLGDPRVSGWVALLPLLYFPAEWVVSATWRGHYGYREDLPGHLGVAFCGPEGNWPCSALYPVMNIATVVTGSAIVLVAASFVVQRVTQRSHALLLGIAGAALAGSGVITQNVDYSWNQTLMGSFLTLGSVAALFIAMESASPLSTDRRVVAVVAGVVGLLGYFATFGHVDVVGVGGAQRMTIYGILIAVIALGSVGMRRRPSLEDRQLVGESR